MATDSERLHVAAMLYDEAADFRNLCEKYDHEWTIDLGDVPAVFQDITHYLGFDGVVRADELFEHLAELIDPSDYDQPYECCPNCGARLVGGND